MTKKTYYKVVFATSRSGSRTVKKFRTRKAATTARTKWVRSMMRRNKSAKTYMKKVTPSMWWER